MIVYSTKTKFQFHFSISKAARLTSTTMDDSKAMLMEKDVQAMLTAYQSRPLSPSAKADRSERCESRVCVCFVLVVPAIYR